MNNIPKFCQKCDREIAGGKEIKIKKYLECKIVYYRGRYRMWETREEPTKEAIYYVCPDCFKKIERELAEIERKKNIRDWVVIGLCTIGVIILVVILAFYYGLDLRRKYY